MVGVQRTSFPDFKTEIETYGNEFVQQCIPPDIIHPAADLGDFFLHCFLSQKQGTSPVFRKQSSKSVYNFKVNSFSKTFIDLSFPSLLFKRCFKLYFWKFGFYLFVKLAAYLTVGLPQQAFFLNEEKFPPNKRSKVLQRLWKHVLDCKTKREDCGIESQECLGDFNNYKTVKDNIKSSQ